MIDVGESSWELHISLSCLAILAHFFCSHVFSAPVTRSMSLLVSRTHHPTTSTQPWLWIDTSFCVKDSLPLLVWNILYSKYRKPTLLTFKIWFKNKISPMLKAVINALSSAPAAPLFLNTFTLIIICLCSYIVIELKDLCGQPSSNIFSLITEPTIYIVSPQSIALNTQFDQSMLTLKKLNLCYRDKIIWSKILELQHR